MPCRYQDYQANVIPTVEKDGLTVRVMAGEAHGATGPVFMRNPGMLVDVSVQAGAHFSEKVHACTSAPSFVHPSSGALVC